MAAGILERDSKLAEQSKLSAAGLFSLEVSSKEQFAEMDGRSGRFRIKTDEFCI